MILYRHHCCSDFIELDDASGALRPIAEAVEPHWDGLAWIGMRIDAAIRGSYTIEDGRRCCLYWNDAHELVLRADGGTHPALRLPLFRRGADDAALALIPGLQLRREASKHAADRSTVSLHDGAGALLFAIDYDAMRYLALLGMNSMIAHVPDEELGDWDFFVALETAVHDLELLAKAAAGGGDGLVLAASGEPAAGGGWWFACHHLAVNRHLAVGERVLEVDGAGDTWVWSGRWNGDGDVAEPGTATTSAVTIGPQAAAPPAGGWRALLRWSALAVVAACIVVYFVVYLVGYLSAGSR